jgi:hypothetical protein
MKDKNVQNLCETDRAFSVISAYAVKERALSSAIPNLGGRRQQRVGSEADGGCAALIHPTKPAPL